MTYEERKARLITAVRAEAKEQSEQINRSTDEYVNSELIKAEADLRREIDADIRSRTLNLRREIGIAVAAEQRAADAELYSRRRKIEDGVFGEVKEMLAEFRAGDGYEAYLLHGAKELNSVFTGKNEITLFYTPDDEKYADILRSVIAAPVKTVPADDIRLGGFRAECAAERLAADYTLDKALESRHDEFRSTPGLCINI